MKARMACGIVIAASILINQASAQLTSVIYASGGSLGSLHRLESISVTRDGQSYTYEFNQLLLPRLVVNNPAGLLTIVTHGATIKDADMFLRDQYLNTGTLDIGDGNGASFGAGDKWTLLSFDPPLVNEEGPDGFVVTLQSLDIVLSYSPWLLATSAGNFQVGAGSGGLVGTKSDSLPMYTYITQVSTPQDLLDKTPVASGWLNNQTWVMQEFDLQSMGVAPGAQVDALYVQDWAANGNGSYPMMIAGFPSLTPAEPVTFLYYTSERGDFIGAGQTRYFTPADGTFDADENFDNGVGVSFNQLGLDGEWWYMDFAAAGNAALTPGEYPNAMRFPFQEPDEHGLDFSGTGRGCNTLTGEFRIYQSELDEQGNVLHFAATLEQHCSGNTPALFAMVAYEATVPLPPVLISASSRRQHGATGPTFDIPASLNMAADSPVDPRINGSAPQMVLEFNQPMEAVDGQIDCGAEVVVSGGSCLGVQVVDTTIVIDLSFDPGCATVELDGLRSTTTGLSLFGNKQAHIVSLMGDVDDGNSVNILDLQAIKSEMFQPLGPSNFKYDVDCSGLTNILDLQATKNVLFQNAACP